MGPAGGGSGALLQRTPEFRASSGEGRGLGAGLMVGWGGACGRGRGGRGLRAGLGRGSPQEWDQPGRNLPEKSES